MIHQGASRLWRALLIAAATVAAVRLLRARFGRYAVAGESMVPALRDGDFVIVDRTAYAAIAPVPGHVVLASDPREPRVLVKRVGDVSAGGAVWLEGDNADWSTDSRAFGWVDGDAIRGRVRWRYWPPGSIGSIR